MEKQRYIYRVSFNEPPFAEQGDDTTDFYYTSLSAIYEDFTPKQIGCKLTNLWNIGISRGESYANRNRTCYVWRVPVGSKHRKEASKE